VQALGLHAPLFFAAKQSLLMLQCWYEAISLLAKEEQNKQIYV